MLLEVSRIEIPMGKLGHVGLVSQIQHGVWRPFFLPSFYQHGLGMRCKHEFGVNLYVSKVKDCNLDIIEKLKLIINTH